jgi:hypothetical protein
MDNPERVYCDFETGDANFYLYIGNLNDEV